MSMRLLLYSVAYPGEAGGVQTVFSRLAERLRGQGHTVTRAWRAPNPDRSAGDPMYALPRLTCWHGIPTPRSVFDAGRALVKLGRCLAEARPEIVNVHFVSCESTYFFLLKPLFGYKVVLSVHGSDVLCPHEHDRFLLPRLLPRADAITAVSSVVAARVKTYADVDPARVAVIPNGIDFEFWSAAAAGDAADAADAALDVARRPPTVLTVGRLHRVKGHDLLLRAFARLRERVPQARLIIVGEGPSRTELEQTTDALQIRDGVEFAGELDPQGVRARMNQARAFVLPSRSEGLPLALLEAMAAGVPAVATRVGGVPEVVHAGTGLMVPPEDPAALADALAKVLTDGALAMDLSRKGRERAADFSAARADAAYEQLFVHLMNGHSN